MPRVAVFDCGTNSLRLLIADVEPDGRLVDLVREMQVVRLGQGVDRTGVIAAEAMQRAFRVTDDYARVCAEAGVAAIRFVATSASRDARNRGEFVEGITARLGVRPEVITGAEEAELSFWGATGALAGPEDLAPEHLAPEHPGPALVIDLGGGSTEFVLGALPAAPGDTPSAVTARSVNIGCVRLTERHGFADPPTPAEIAAALADIDAAIDDAAAQVPLERTGTLIGVAGTVTTVTAHALGLTHYDPTVINGTVLPVDTVVAAAAELTAMTRADRAALGFMHPGRVDVIGAGALVWGRIVGRVAQISGITDVVTSEHDILDGMAKKLAASLGS